jgi:hypothetical protein
MNISDELADTSALVDLAERRLNAVGPLERKLTADAETLRLYALELLTKAAHTLQDLRELDRYEGGLTRVRERAEGLEPGEARFPHA